MPKLLLNVLMITYNHEKYIEQSVLSVLNQKTDFEYNIIIGEDCSTDSTRSILLNLKDKYPDKINLLLQETNVGARKNLRMVEELCKAPFIACLEGDDYWTSEDKLQKQVDFLKTNKEYSACVHGINIIDEDNNDWKDNKVIYNIESIYSSTSIFTQIELCSGLLPGQSGTMVYRNILGKLDKHQQELYFSTNCNGDARRTVLLLSFGPIYCFTDKMSSYRFVDTQGSSWSAKIAGKNTVKESLNSYIELELLAQNLISESVSFEIVKCNITVSALLTLIKYPSKDNLAKFRYTYKSLKNKQQFLSLFFKVLIKKIKRG